MEWYQAGALLLGTVVGLMALGFPVAFTFLLTNILGMFVFAAGWQNLIQIADNATSLITSAYLYTGDDKYKQWVLDYVQAWMDRTEENGGIIPDYVGPSGKMVNA